MGSKNIKEISDDQIEDIIKNVANDRASASHSLNDLSKVISTTNDKNQAFKDHGLTVAKLVETMQRSNEQLVKLVSILKKNEKPESLEMSDSDLEDIYDKLQEEKNRVKSNPSVEEEESETK